MQLLCCGYECVYVLYLYVYTYMEYGVVSCLYVTIIIYLTNYLSICFTCRHFITYKRIYSPLLILLVLVLVPLKTPKLMETLKERVRVIVLERRWIVYISRNWSRVTVYGRMDGSGSRLYGIVSSNRYVSMCLCVCVCIFL